MSELIVLKGPVSVGDKVSLVFATTPVGGKSIYYFGTAGSSLDDVLFLPFLTTSGTNIGTISSQLNNNNILTFTVGGVGYQKSLTLTVDDSTGRVVRGLPNASAPSNVNVLSLAPGQNAPALTPYNATYQLPPPNGVVFAGVGYDLSMSARILVNNATYFLAGTYFIVPVTTYLRSPGNSSSHTCTTESNASFNVVTQVCANCPLDGGCGSEILNCSPEKKGIRLTLPEDCSLSTDWQYCTASQTCGTCYGACEVQTDYCTLVTASPTQFVCTKNLIPLPPGTKPGPPDPNPPGPPGPVPISMTVWIAIIVAFVVVVAILALVYYKVRVSDNAYDSGYDYGTDTTSTTGAVGAMGATSSTAGATGSMTSTTVR